MPKITSAFDLDGSYPAGKTEAGYDSSQKEHLGEIDKNVKEILQEISTSIDLNKENTSDSPEDSKGEDEGGVKGLERVLEFFKSLFLEKDKEKEKKEEEIEDKKDPVKELLDGLDAWTTKLEEILVKTEESSKAAGSKTTEVPESKTSQPDNNKLLPNTQNTAPQNIKIPAPQEGATGSPKNIVENVTVKSPVSEKIPDNILPKGEGVSGVQNVLSAASKESGGDTRNTDVYVSDKHGSDPSKDATHLKNPTNAPIQVLSNEYIKNLTEVKELNNFVKELPRFYEGTVNNISSPETHIHNMDTGTPEQGGLLDPFKNANSPVKETLARYSEGTSTNNTSESVTHSSITNQHNNTQDINTSQNQHNIQNTSISTYNEGTSSPSAHIQSSSDSKLESVKEYFNTDSNKLNEISKYVEGTYKELNNSSKETLNNIFSSKEDLKELSRFYEGTSSTTHSLTERESTSHKDSHTSDNKTTNNVSSSVDTQHSKDSLSIKDNVFSKETFNSIFSNLDKHVTNNIEKTISSSLDKTDISRYYEGTKDTVTSMSEVTNPTNVSTINSYINSYSTGVGATTEGMFIVGDSKNVDPRSPSDTTSEIIINPTNAPIIVKNNRESKNILDDLSSQGMKKFSEGTEGLGALASLPIGDLGKAATFTAAAGTGGSARDFAGGAFDAVTTAMKAFGDEAQLITSVFASLGKVLVDVVQGFNALSERVAPFSPEISQAKASLQIKEIDFASNVATQSGGQLGRLYEASGEIWLDIQNILYEISRPFLSIIVPAVEYLRGFIQGVMQFSAMIRDMFVSFGQLLAIFNGTDWKDAKESFITDFINAFKGIFTTKEKPIVESDLTFTNIAIATSGLT